VRSAGKPSAVWRINNAEGETQALHVRFNHPEGKKCRWRRPLGRLGYTWTVRSGTSPAYRITYNA
jgi:hypothetical protein